MAGHRGNQEPAGHVGNGGGLNDFSFLLFLLFIKGSWWRWEDWGGDSDEWMWCLAVRLFFFPF